MKWYAQMTQEFGRFMADAFSYAQSSQSGETAASQSTSAPEAQPAPGDEAAPGTVGTGENLCPHCRGTGKIDGETCSNCGGTGKIVEGIGGG
jgi:hypothetical protein